MIDFHVAAVTLFARLQSQYSAILPARHFCWNDGHGEPPSGSDPWVAIEVLGAGGGQRGVGVPGQRLNIHGGVMMVHVFTATGTGRDAARAHTRDIADLFTYKDMDADGGGKVRTEAPQWAGEGPGTIDGNWARSSFSVPFDLYQFF